MPDNAMPLIFDLLQYHLNYSFLWLFSQYLTMTLTTLESAYEFLILY